jgi:hypothetical protein
MSLGGFVLLIYIDFHPKKGADRLIVLFRLNCGVGKHECLLSSQFLRDALGNLRYRRNAIRHL